MIGRLHRVAIDCPAPDVMVDDVDAADLRIMALGARRLAGQGSARVYADPAGHPFCLIPRSAWAAPIGDVQEGKPGTSSG